MRKSGIWRFVNVYIDVVGNVMHQVTSEHGVIFLYLLCWHSVTFYKIEKIKF